jgi:lysophospholipase L1-like esterase
LTVVLLIAEVAVRVLVPESLWRLRNNSDDWQQDALAGWAQKSNLNVAHRHDHGIVHFSTNPDGVYPAGTHRQRPINATRILLFGDSTVVGRNLPENERLLAHLTAQLRACGIVAEVICAGVEGYSTDQALIRMQQLVPLYQPDLILHVTCANDFAGNELNFAYGLPKPRFALIENTLRRIEAAQGVAAYPEERGSFSLRQVVQHSALYRVVRPALVRMRSSADWRTRNLAGFDDTEPQSLDRYDWNLFGALIREMRLVAETNQTRVLLYAHPSVNEVWATNVPITNRLALSRRLETTAASNGVFFCPLVEYFLTNQHRGPFHLLPRDPHCNSTGYKLTAERLAQFISQHSVLTPRTNVAGGLP